MEADAPQGDRRQPWPASIVVGIDGSRTGWRAFSAALGVANRYKAFVRACYVAHMPATAEMGVFGVAVPPVLDEGEDLRDEVNKELAEAGIPGDFVVLKGDVAHELEAVAEDCHADIIVVGRSQHPALHLGGVPRKLLALGHRPVLVVP
ncbi:MAG TPA: universal stress protein [Acidimicrobiales bacterium]|nr:universal stress protein [Acidimicrobiales bacterium]